MTWRPMLLGMHLGLASLWCVGARADSTSQDPRGYSDVIKQALTELEAGNYPEAREEFLQAHKLSPNARTLRGLGMVEFELRDYVQCVQRLREALSSTVKPLEGKLRADTESLLARAQRYLGELHVEVDPNDAAVKVDGTPLKAAGRTALLLEVGEHRLDVEAPGHRSEHRTFRVQGGVRLDLDVKLSQLHEADEPSAMKTTSTPAQSERTPGYKKWWVWTTVAIVAIAGGVTAALLLMPDKEQRTRPAGSANVAGPTVYTLQRF